MEEKNLPKANIKFTDFICRKFKWIKTISLLSLFLTSFLFSETYYVDTTGTDNAFCSQSNPCEHIQTAIDLTVDGDIVRVLVGTYYENVFIRTEISLLSDDPLNPAVINGSQPNDIDFSSCIIVKTPRGRNTRISATIEDITLTGGKGTVIIEDSNKDEVAEEADATPTKAKVEMDPETAANMAMQTEIVQATYNDIRNDLPEFRSGDTISVGYRVIEGSRSRIQSFDGVVIKISSGHGLDKTFTVRKISGGIGVERIFPFHSPNIESIKVLKEGKVRRAKLYYLRRRKGKATRIREKTQ